MKKYIAVAVSAVIAFNMVGCTTSSDSSASASGASTQEITMWGSWSGTQIDQLNQQLETYNESQDTYHVTYTMEEDMEEKLLTAIAGGGVPDVVLWDRFNTSLYASKGALMSLDDLVNQDSIDMTQFYDQAVKEMTYNGSVYGIPLTVDTRVIFYNKDLLSQAGVDPTSIKTWDDLADAASKCTIWNGDQLVQSGFSLDDAGLFNMYLWQAGGQLLSDDGMTCAFNSPEGLEVLNYWDKLQNQLKVYQQGFGEGIDGFASGIIAMKYDGPWDLETYNAIDGLNYGVIEPPVGPNGDKGAMMGGFGLVIPTGAKNIDGAWDFIKWWATQPENEVAFAKISSQLPANKSASQDEYFANDPTLSVFTSTMEYAQVRPTTLGYSDVDTLAIKPQMELFMNGDESAQDALSAAETQGNQILEQTREDNA